MVIAADLILVLESGHKTDIDAINLTLRGKLYQFCEGRDSDICNPYQQPKAAFAKELKDIQGAVVDWVSRTILSSRRRPLCCYKQSRLVR